jgi:hypothetical protein
MDEKKNLNTTPDTSRTPSLSVAIFILITAGVLTYYLFNYYRNYPQVKTERLPDYYSQVSNEDLYAKGNELREEHKYEEAVIVFQQGLDQAKDSSEKSIYAIAVGTTNALLNPQYGVTWLVKLGNDTTYPNVSRAYALQYAYQIYSSYRDPLLLKPFFTDEEYKNIDWSNDASRSTTIRQIHERIESIWRLPLTEARLAYLTWLDSKNIADVNKHMLAFVELAHEAEGYEGMQTLIPPAYLTAAYLAADMKKDGTPLTIGTSSPDYFFKEAIQQSQRLNLENTYQFSVLGYANYLIGNNEYQKGIDALKQLVTHITDPAVKAAITSSTVSTRYPDLIKKAQTDKDVKDLLLEIGFNL